MPSKRNPITFTVEGTYPFPVDMLRYDACWPATSDDAVSVAALLNLRRGHSVDKRRIRLTTNAENSPTVGRWESFAWKVV